MIGIIYLIGFIVTLCAALYIMRDDRHCYSHVWQETIVMCILIAFIWPAFAPVYLLVKFIVFVTTIKIRVD